MENTIKEVYRKLEENNINNSKNIYLYLQKNKDQAGIKWKSVSELFWYFNQVHSEWLTFDWKNITIWYRWLQYMYQALKNKMLIHYPESIIDIQLVFKWDDFNVEKKDWKVLYNHKINNPFKREEKDIEWWYCVIKNKRWEFITVLSENDFQTHKKKAKTKFIWNEWWAEMRIKTLFRKALSVHYEDEFKTIFKEDNKNFDLNKIEKVNLSWFSKIEEPKEENKEENKEEILEDMKKSLTE